ncbi:ABC transporter ATPase [Psychroflexus montanilacus]|uniref:ABC transporter ATPase n=1 Tax=Psychroflexus montanilacus TaxID=2873598 RepID=UPI001CC96640|nr:ABC transporter ATPase [Psychroflexus montanilacus]MBZ9650408.1 ABC transporter ATPase [Psychroflexus montanilacus]
MVVDFKELPDSSRVWIFQANRGFSEDELKEIKPKIENFLEGWTVHGQSLKAGFEIRYNRFIILGLDESQANASGCSIDASVHFIQSLEKEYNVDLLDKMNVSFKNGEFVAYKPLLDFKKMVKQKAVSPQTIVFNNLVNTKEEYKEFWEVPMTESWHSRLL